MSEAVVGSRGTPLAARGPTFAVYEVAHDTDPARGRTAGASYSGRRPWEVAPLHVHHRGDEAWYVVEGVLAFRFADRTLDATGGMSVFVPAGVAHTFGAPGPGPVRYVLIAATHVQELIDELHTLDSPTADEYAAVYTRHDSEVLEDWG